MPKSKKAAVSAKETVRVIAQLFDLYGIDRSPDRDRKLDSERSELALYCAVRYGLVQLPRKRGAPTKWKGQLGLELIEAVESLRAGTVPSLRPLSVAKAIDTLQEKYPKKWGCYDCDDLKKRYYEAKKVWGYGTRLMMFIDPWHKKHPENS